MVTKPPKAARCHRSASDDFVASIIRSDCYRLERKLLGGPRNPLRDGTLSERDFAGSKQTGARTITIPTSGTASFTVATVDDGADEPGGGVTATLGNG